MVYIITLETEVGTLTNLRNTAMVLIITKIHLIVLSIKGFGTIHSLVLAIGGMSLHFQNVILLISSGKTILLLLAESLINFLSVALMVLDLMLQMNWMIQ